jgi:hypothetical protein
VQQRRTPKALRAKNHVIAETGALGQFMVFFGRFSLCLTNSARLVTFDKDEG